MGLKALALLLFKRNHQLFVEATSFSSWYVIQKNNFSGF